MAASVANGGNKSGSPAMATGVGGGGENPAPTTKGRKDATDVIDLGSFDSESITRGFSSLDTMMKALQQKKEIAWREMEKDREEIKWLDREIAMTQPKLDKLCGDIAQRQAKRDALAAHIEASGKSFDTLAAEAKLAVMKASKKAMQLKGERHLRKV